MVDLRVDMDLGTGDNDGTTWANAYNGKAGFVTAIAAQTAGETIYVNSTVSNGTTMILQGLATLAGALDPVKVIGVRSDASDTVLQTDIILGHREGDATLAYNQTSAELPPDITATGSGDITINGSLYFYGFRLSCEDNFLFIPAASIGFIEFEECLLDAGGAASDQFAWGNSSSDHSKRAILRNCSLTLGGTPMLVKGVMDLDFYDCIITSTVVGMITSAKFGGTIRFYGCDLTGCNATLVNVSQFYNGRVEFHNCRMPATHILKTGTETGFYTIVNYGSEDNTGLDSADSEQALEIETNYGTIDLDPTNTRAGGADDEATSSGGPFAWALNAVAVQDNLTAVVSPWMGKWVLGDGTEQTLTVFIANDSGTDMQDDEVFLEVLYPSEAGISMYDYRPDQDAPTGTGRMRLLGTPANLANDAVSNWGGAGAGEPESQTLTVTIDPDYRGLVKCRVHYSQSGSNTLFVDPQPTIA